MDFGFGSYYGTHIWFFKTPEQFVAFLPALLFFDIAIHWDDNDRNYRNYEEEDDDENEFLDEEELDAYESKEEHTSNQSTNVINPISEKEDEDDEDDDDIRMIEDTEDYKDTFDYYKNLCEIKSFDDIRIYDLVEDSFGEVEVLDIARVSDLINISKEKFNLTFEDTEDEVEIQEKGFTWTQFKILHGYPEKYNEIPSKNVGQFLEFLEDCNHDWLELPYT